MVCFWKLMLATVAGRPGAMELDSASVVVSSATASSSPSGMGARRRFICESSWRSLRAPIDETAMAPRIAVAETRARVRSLMRTGLPGRRAG
jgi:hypothetical protein